MTIDTSRWKTSPDYTYTEDLVAPDLAWEWLRRNDDYQQDYRQNEMRQAPRETLAERLRRHWGLEFFCPAVSDGCSNHNLLVA
jgi:hypothetical protein|tara:strand:+ start:13480 stop:13728 length:249 start_codon:yes stop_codon:yes gene_type:complete